MSAPAPGRPAQGSDRGAVTPSPRRGALAEEVAPAVLAGVLALVAVAIVLRLWNDAALRYPLGYGGDALWTQQVVKGIVDHGWFFTNPDVGAPFGQQLYDFTGAFGDTLHLLVIKAMTLGSQDPVKLVNAYFLLGFSLCAASACLVLRRLGASRGAAVVAAVLFALLPAHVGGGEGRLMLGAYWSVPFTALLVMRVFGGERLFARRTSGHRSARWGSRRTLGTVAMCVLIAGSGLYYAMFTVMLLLLAALAVGLVRRDRSAVLGGGLAALIVLGLFFAQLAPAILYGQEHGPNPELSDRPVSDSSVYATSLSLLVLPALEHRWEPARLLARRLEAGKVPPGANENALSALGIVASLGFLGLLLVAVVPGARRGSDRAGPAAATALTAFLLGTVGGIGLIVALLFSSDLRGWGRISPLIGFVGLFGVALAYDALRRRSASSRGRWAVAALLPVALVLGVADQTTENMVPSYDDTRMQYTSDARFVRDIEALLPPRAGVLQLPPAPFPEGGTIERMVDYSLMRGPLHSRSLRFSYGSVKGRPEGEWVRRLSRLPLERALPYYVATGFRGIWVDRRGYADQGAGLDVALRRLRAAPITPLASDDDELRFYSLVDYARRWAAGRSARQLRMANESALHLTDISRGPGTGLVPATEVPQILDPAAGGSMIFRNPGRLARTVIARGLLQTPREGVVDVVATLPDGRRVRLRANRGGRRFELRVPLQPSGQEQVRFVAPRARGPLVISGLVGLDAALAPL